MGRTLYKGDRTLEAKYTAIPVLLDFPPVEVPDFEKIAAGDESATEIITFKIYKKGPGCPVPIVIETDFIIVEYTESFPENEEGKSSARYMAEYRRNDLIVRRDLLLNVLKPKPHLEVANILANSDEGLKILALGGWWSSGEVKEGDDEEEVEETPKGEEEIGQSTSLTLVQPTQE